MLCRFRYSSSRAAGLLRQLSSPTEKPIAEAARAHQSATALQPRAENPIPHGPNEMDHDGLASAARRPNQNNRKYPSKSAEKSGHIITEPPRAQQSASALRPRAANHIPHDQNEMDHNGTVSLHSAPAPRRPNQNNRKYLPKSKRPGNKHSAERHQSKEHFSERGEPQRLQNVSLPCAQHLDPKGILLPSSCWIHVDGVPPLCTLHTILDTFIELLAVEQEQGIVDLDAFWNPIEDQAVPTLPTKLSIPNWIEAAHVVLSPFGRPTGWHVKFTNRSIVNAILTHAQDETIYCAWKSVKVNEWKPIKEKVHPNRPIVSDSMVRVENVPNTMTASLLMLMLSRYDLATQDGPTIIEWQDATSDGKVAPLMFVVRFADAAWARAALRELQSSRVEGKTIKLAQYPQQIRYDIESTTTKLVQGTR
jgi:hypothetical protein